MAGQRVYTLNDVLKQLNEQSTQNNENPTQVAATLVSVSEAPTVSDYATFSLVSGSFYWGPVNPGQNRGYWGAATWG